MAQGRASDRRGAGDTDFEVQGGDVQTRGPSARGSPNRCEPSLPNGMPARGVIEGHARRPDARPIEDPAERPKITLAKRGASTHASSFPDGVSFVASGDVTRGLGPFEVASLGLRRRHVADRAQEAMLVVPFPPVHGLPFDVLHGSPRPEPLDDLGLEQADHGLGEGVMGWTPPAPGPRSGRSGTGRTGPWKCWLSTWRSSRFTSTA